jgi:glyoxylase-like metal-dependent hydrolase (beta-lactamase superfamily II)
MNPLEAQLHYPLADTLPDAGTTIQIAPGVLWLRMALPFALNHINLWLIADEKTTADGVIEGWAIVDCGIADEATKAAWERLFAESESTEGLQGRPVLRVIATHCHPDHIGLADWLCQRWNVALWVTTGEYAFARMMSAGLAGADGTAMYPHFRKHGLTDPALEERISERKNYYTRMVPSVPISYHRISDGETLAIGEHAWQVITGFGHSPEHAALYCEDLNLLISGDMVLPRISTNVSVFAIEPEANPVKQYLDSLQKFRHLPDDVLVLPSHGKPFKGMHTRIDQLEAHHAERLAEVVDACMTPQSAADIVPIMFRRPLDAHQLTFALGEALAHLHMLWIDGVLVREVGEDGVVRFFVEG